MKPCLEFNLSDPIPSLCTCLTAVHTCWVEGHVNGLMRGTKHSNQGLPTIKALPTQPTATVWPTQPLSQQQRCGPQPLSLQPLSQQQRCGPQPLSQQQQCGPLNHSAYTVDPTATATAGRNGALCLPAPWHWQPHRRCERPRVTAGELGEMPTRQLAGWNWWRWKLRDQQQVAEVEGVRSCWVATVRVDEGLRMSERERERERGNSAATRRGCLTGRWQTRACSAREGRRALA